MAAKDRNKNKWAIVAYDKNAPLEGGGKIIAQGEELELRAGQTLVLRVRGYDKRGRAMQAIEIAQTVREDPYR